ncbi:MAG: hypothetical protein K9K67_02170 [Bacteriovoracaceae bacterium]|nr:hypothetical protein [Bacteriovoracaceae bacterium]
MYLIYLLVLGQGCSALKSTDHIIAVPIPSLQSISKVTSPHLKPITFTSAPKQLLADKPLLLVQAEKPSEVTPRKQLVLNELKVETVKKNYEVEEIEDYELIVVETKTEKTDKAVLKGEHELSMDKGIEHYGFKVDSEVLVTSWSDELTNVMEGKLAELENLEKNRQETNMAVDTVTNMQAAPATSYDPTDPKLLAMFNNNEINVEEIIKKKEKKENKTDDLVLIDYANEESELEKGIAKVAASPISQAVKRVIAREMGPVEKAVSQNLMAVSGQKLEGNKPTPENISDKNEIELHTIEANLDEGFGESVTNFNFIPSYDTNEVLEDFSEGKITFEYSLKNTTGLLRGTVVKNFFIRTSFEIPLGGEYSRFEIPMISQESIQNYLDKNNLEGYGGFYLADLGENLEDVEIEKFSNSKKIVYEHRLLLDENFKKVNGGQGFRYVLFIGVEPGNINVRYLGINGQQTSKITFVAPEELLYDFSQLERPTDYNIKTKLQNTLGKTPTIIDISPQKIMNILNEKNPRKVAPGEYVLTSPYRIKGSRSYIELEYLSDSIFVGLDDDKEIELPSNEFIAEVLRSFNMDGLNQECLVQVNLKGSIKDIKILGETFRGPAVFDFSYLDKDGVFSSEISPLTEKLFLLGNEEGIYNLKVEYESGKTDFIRTYCSPSTYLLEQL